MTSSNPAWNDDDCAALLAPVAPEPHALAPSATEAPPAPGPKKRRRGRPRLPNSLMPRPAQARLPLALQVRLESHLRETGLSPSDFIRAAVERELDRLDFAHS